MRFAVLLPLVAISALCADPAFIASVRIEGARHPVELETKPGVSLDPDRIERDVRRLWATGLFDDIRVESHSKGEIVFRVAERRPTALNRIQFTPGSEHVPLQIPKGSPIDAVSAQSIATALETQFRQDGYQEPQVTTTLLPSKSGSADLRLSIKRGPQTRIGAVRLLGSTGLPRKEIEQALRQIRPKTVIPGIWKLRSAYSPEAVQSGIARVRSLLFSRGYFDATVRLDNIQQSKGKAFVSISIDSGESYGIGRIEIIDVGKAADFAPDIGRPLRVSGLCSCLLDLRRQAQKEGRLDFETSIAASDSGNSAGGRTVDLTVEVRTGPPYKVGRIEFQGNRAVRDSTVRKAFVMEPSQPFDLQALNRSLQRVNRMGLFEPLSTQSVRIVRSQEAGTADVQIRLKEMPLRRWWLSGPAGPFKVGGPLNAAVSSRLPGWGRGLIEGSTYFLTFSVSAFSSPLFKALQIAPPSTILPVVLLERPILPGQSWTSGFAIAPQLGWRGMAANYAVSQFRSRLGDVLRGQPPLEPEIVSEIQRQRAGEDPVEAGALICERRTSRWLKLRNFGAGVLNLALSPALLQ